MTTGYDEIAAGVIWGGDASESAEPAGRLLARPEGRERARTTIVIGGGDVLVAALRAA
jgi:hypothetical protein